MPGFWHGNCCALVFTGSEWGRAGEKRLDNGKNGLNYVLDAKIYFRVFSRLAHFSGAKMTETHPANRRG
jgi:hypothetical protein